MFIGLERVEAAIWPWRSLRREELAIATLPTDAPISPPRQRMQHDSTVGPRPSAVMSKPARTAASGASPTNSCRNRHCPKCQGAAARTWLAEREADLLPVGYFHVVFTLPAEVADIAFHNKALVYDLLFRTASETMLTIAADPRHRGARIGITAVLHTWGSALTHHPHVHMIVPGGGIAPGGSRWIASRRPAAKICGRDGAAAAPSSYLYMQTRASRMAVVVAPNMPQRGTWWVGFVRRKPAT
jgi:Transposase zinc-binding domain/Putative transposase